MRTEADELTEKRREDLSRITGALGGWLREYHGNRLRNGVMLYDLFRKLENINGHFWLPSFVKWKSDGNYGNAELSFERAEGEDRYIRFSVDDEGKAWKGPEIKEVIERRRTIMDLIQGRKPMKVEYRVRPGLPVKEEITIEEFCNEYGKTLEEILEKGKDGREKINDLRARMSRI